MKNKFLIAFLSFLILCVGFAIVVAKTMVKENVSGRALPNISMPTLSAGTKSLSDLPRGVSILVTYASWCAVCKEEQPFLMSLKEQGVKMYGIAWKDKPSKTKRFLNETGNPFVWTFVDETTELTKPLNIIGTPEFVFIRNGMVMYKHVGPVNKNIWENTLKPLMDSFNIS